MAKLLIYTLYDRKLGEYGTLVTGSNDGVVVRSMRDELPKEALPARYPEDFSMVCVGSYDTITGELISEKSPRVVLLMETLFGKEG